VAGLVESLVNSNLGRIVRLTPLKQQMQLAIELRQLPSSGLHHLVKSPTLNNFQASRSLSIDHPSKVRLLQMYVFDPKKRWRLYIARATK